MRTQSRFKRVVAEIASQLSSKSRQAYLRSNLRHFSLASLTVLFFLSLFTSTTFANPTCEEYLLKTAQVELTKIDSTILHETAADINPEIEIRPEDVPSEFRALRKQTVWSNLSYPAKVAWNWIHSTMHNFRGVFAVVDLMALRKMPDKLIPEDHPWVTGISPHTGQKIWKDNIVFASPKNQKAKLGASDEEIVTKIGAFLASMTKRSTAETEIPQGPKRRMPHAVNYIHGTVNFNGVFMVFNNFRDAMFYFSDPSFVKEFKRVGLTEKREITVVFRDREYEPYQLAYFMGFVRSTLPWYANGNGPKKKVFYGAMSSYPAINTINGSWIQDMYELKKNGPDSLVRPPVEKNKYFQKSYQGDRDRYTVLERALTYLNYKIVRARGVQGGMVFTKRELIEPEKVKDFEETGSIDAGVDWEFPDFADEISDRLDQP